MTQILFGILVAQILKCRIIQFEKVPVRYVFVTCDSSFDEIISAKRRIQIFSRSVTKENTVLDYCKCPCKLLNTDCGCDFKSHSYISAVCIEHIMFASSIFNQKIVKTVFDLIWKNYLFICKQ